MRQIVSRVKKWSVEGVIHSVKKKQSLNCFVMILLGVGVILGEVSERSVNSVAIASKNVIDF